jgi:hypothetical protein
MAMPTSCNLQLAWLAGCYYLCPGSPGSKRFAHPDVKADDQTRRGELGNRRRADNINPATKNKNIFAWPKRILMSA